MIAPIVHRGPDDRGSWVDEESGVGLGVRRLAILDLSPTGHQPMVSPSGRYVGVLNAEVYNYGELRGELAASGISFRGHCDSEVILAAVERWGIEAAVKRFVGMFAIALWDRHERVLHLIRDRLGIKPLFVYAEPGRVAFASELKSIMALPEVDRTIDRGALLAYLRRLHVPGPLSIFKRVVKVSPGHILTIRSADEPLPDPVPYWRAAEAAAAGLADPIADERDGLEQLESLLRDAVRFRMISDVPLGAFLSGGIDSSLVVALMQEASGAPVRTFSIGFDDVRHDEAPYAAAIAAHLGTDHTPEILTAEDARAMIPRLPECFDEPIADPSAICNLLVCSVARRSVTVALTGVGGDEVFGGYNRYAQLERATRLLRLPAPARRLAGWSLAMIPADAWDTMHTALVPVLPAARHLRLAGEKARKLSILLRQSTPEEMYRSLTSAWQNPNAFVRDDTESNGDSDSVFVNGGPARTLVERAMLSDQMGYLPDDQLVIADRTSMAMSLEARVPLIDHRVVELSWRLPLSLKIRNGAGKWCLRRLLERRVPTSLFERPKVGFSVPLDRWLRGALRPWADEHFAPDRLRSDGILDPAAVRAAWTAFQGGRGEGAIAIWTLLVFQEWVERWGAVSE